MRQPLGNNALARCIALGQLKAAATSGNYEAFAMRLKQLDWPGAWREAFALIAGLDEVHPRIQANFEVEIWPSAGAPLRRAIADDDVLADALWRLFLSPPYGGAGEMLCRGQSLEAFEKGRIGFSWTIWPKVAKLYAYARSYAHCGPAVILRAFVQPEAIISITGSAEGGEWLVDPRLVKDVEVIGTLTTEEPDYMDHVNRLRYVPAPPPKPSGLWNSLFKPLCAISLPAVRSPRTAKSPARGTRSAVTDCHVSEGLDF